MFRIGFGGTDQYAIWIVGRGECKHLLRNADAGKRNRRLHNQQFITVIGHC